jgi:multidrug efflux system membrane fusion protein
MRLQFTGSVSSLFFAAAVLAAVTVAGCSGGEAVQATPPSGRGSAPPAVPVTVAPVVQKSMPLAIEGIGTVIAASTVSVHAQITGELTSVDFIEGQDVEKGQVIVTLDKRPLEAALQQAQAALNRDLAQVANAQAQAVRYQDLLKRGIATREQVDQISSNAAALEATVAADRAAVESATVQLDYATIRSPLSGRTGLLQVHPGNLVRANDTQAIVTINKITPVYVSFSIPEAELPELKRYMARGELSVAAQPPNDAGAPSLGKMTFVDNAVDASTGQIKVKGTFPNDDRRLWPGQFVNVHVTLSAESTAIAAPTLAVQTGQQGTYVFVVKSDQTVELRPIIVKRTVGKETVIESGLKPGEIVVTDGHLRLVAGSRVSVKTGATEKTAS